MASMIMSTPSPQWILKKLRNFPQSINVKVIKSTGHDQWARVGKGYRHWFHPDLRHSGVRTVFKDHFKCKMPNDFYRWYKPLRDAYEDMALALLKEKWEQLAERSKGILLEQLPRLSVPSLKGYTKNIIK